MAGLNPKIDALMDQATMWRSEIALLRPILIDCGLTEEKKWKQPCYTLDGKNIVIIYSLKESCGLGFFKGALLSDPEGILVQLGANSQAVRVIKFQNADEIQAFEPVVRAYIANAIAAEKAGLKIDFKEKYELIYAVELQQMLDADPEFAAAFASLTPGRRRGYNLFFSAPKQSKTRAARIEKWMPKILDGKGMHDR